MNKEWKQNKLVSGYSLETMISDTGNTVVTNPPLVDNETFIADIEAGRQMPGWSGTINFNNTKGDPITKTVIGSYQITFPVSSKYKSIYRFKGSHKSNGAIIIEMHDIIENKTISSKLHIATNDVSPDRVYEHDGEFPYGLVSMADELLEADIQPVFTSTFLGVPGVQSKRFTLLALLEGTAPLIVLWQGEQYGFKVQKDNGSLIDMEKGFTLIAGIELGHVSPHRRFQLRCGVDCGLQFTNEQLSELLSITRTELTTTLGDPKITLTSLTLCWTESQTVT